MTNQNMTSQLIETIPDHSLLAFNGQMLKQTSTTIRLGDFDTRTLELNLFVVEGGGFVSSIEFRSLNNCEQDVLVAERVDSAKDAELAFRVFEPLEYIKDRELNRQIRYSDHGKQLVRELTKTYEKQTHIILNSLAEYHTTHPECEVTADPLPAAKQSFWQWIGFASPATQKEI